MLLEFQQQLVEAEVFLVCVVGGVVHRENWSGDLLRLFVPCTNRLVRNDEMAHLAERSPPSFVAKSLNDKMWLCTAAEVFPCTRSASSRCIALAASLSELPVIREFHILVCQCPDSRAFQYLSIAVELCEELDRFEIVCLVNLLVTQGPQYESVEAPVLFLLDSAFFL